MQFHHQRRHHYHYHHHHHRQRCNGSSSNHQAASGDAAFRSSTFGVGQLQQQQRRHMASQGTRHVAAACQVVLHIPFWRIPRHAPKASASGKMRRRNHPKVEVSPQSAAAGDQYKTQFHGRYGLHLDEGRGNLNNNNSNNKRSHTMVVDLL